RGELLAVCTTLAEATEAIGAHEIDLLITDLRLPDGNGIDAIRLLRARHPAAEAMVISILADERTVLDAIEAGASGDLLKDADPRDLIEAIDDLMAGQSPISPSIARVLVRRLADRNDAPTASEPRSAAPPTALTPRET